MFTCFLKNSHIMQFTSVEAELLCSCSIWHCIRNRSIWRNLYPKSYQKCYFTPMLKPKHDESVKQYFVGQKSFTFCSIYITVCTVLLYVKNNVWGKRFLLSSVYIYILQCLLYVKNNVTQCKKCHSKYYKI